MKTHGVYLSLACNLRLDLQGHCATQVKERLMLSEQLRYLVLVQQNLMMADDGPDRKVRDGKP